MQPRLCFTFGVIAVAVATTRSAEAEPAAAEALFREGHELLREGRYAEAAAKLVESQAQDPASGTLINLALAYEKLGRLATAWATYQQAAVLARQDGRNDRVATAGRKRAELEPRIPRLTLHAERPPKGFLVTWGGVRAGVGALDSAIPVDPGDIHIVASAPDHQNWEVKLTLLEGESRTVVIPELAALESAAPPATDASETMPSVPKLAATTPMRKAPTRPVRVSRDRTLAFALGASGIVSLGVGMAFGVHALNRYGEAEHLCRSHDACGARALEAWRSAQTSAWISNIGIGVGAIACAASAWLLFSGNASSRSVAFGVTPHASGATIALRSQL